MNETMKGCISVFDGRSLSSYLVLHVQRRNTQNIWRFNLAFREHAELKGGREDERWNWMHRVGHVSHTRN